MAYIVGALVVLWLLNKLFRGVGGGGGHTGVGGDVEY